jgi:glycosyltransferase involved in cell wall biosynthesis
VTCICPTRNRTRYLPTAIACFLAQTYPRKELLIVEDGDEDARSIIPRDDSIRYIRLAERLQIGEKRNFCCQQARGEIIAHWDDDDWSFAGRLADQISALSGTVRVSGYRTIHFYDDQSGHVHEYHGGHAYVVGTSLLYRREWWRGHPFRSTNCGEDNDFVAAARGSLAVLEGLGKMVALTHSNGTSPRSMNPKQWRPVDPSALPWRPN